LAVTLAHFFHPRILNPAGLNQEIGSQSFVGGWRGECLVPRSDGTCLPVYLSSTAIRDDHGRTLGVIGIAQDIIMRKRTEEALRAREEQFRQAGREYLRCLFRKHARSSARYQNRFAPRTSFAAIEDFVPNAAPE
jgi:PAS domain-containing protein